MKWIDPLSKVLYIIKQRITTAFIVVVMLIFFVSCQKNNKEFVDFTFDSELTPTMTTDSVTTLISDSGITRYKLVADKWLVFDKSKEPYWFFPQGFYLERFDLLFNIEATIIADTAWNYTNKRLWKLKGNVEIENMKGELFKSDELFWDEKARNVYSDKYIEIIKGTTELKGYGFMSNQEMTEYTIFRPHDGRIPFEENTETQTEQQTDSIQKE